MRVALAQIAPKLSRDNFTKHFEYIDRALNQKADIIVFPELSLSGYNLKDAVKDFGYELEEFQEIVDRSLDIDIIFGAALKEKDRFYNAAFYASGQKIEHIHKKVILPNYGMFEEARFFDASKDICSFDIKGVESLLLICEDAWDKELLHKIDKENIQKIFILSNSPARGFLDDGGLDIAKRWEDLIVEISSLFEAEIVFVNRVGFEDGMGFWGGSMVCSNNMKIINKAKLFKEQLLIQEI